MQLISLFVGASALLIAVGIVVMDIINIQNSKSFKVTRKDNGKTIKVSKEMKDEDIHKLVELFR